MDFQNKGKLLETKQNIRDHPFFGTEEFLGTSSLPFPLTCIISMTYHDFFTERPVGFSAHFLLQLLFNTHQDDRNQTIQLNC